MKLTIETYNFLMHILDNHKISIQDNNEKDAEQQMKEVHIAERELETIETY
jgi:hypothetical protein